MGDADRSRHQLRKKRRPGVILKELRIEGKQMGIKDLLDPRQIGLCVLGIRVIALNRQG